MNKNNHNHVLLTATIFIGCLLVIGYLASMLVSAKEIKVPPVPNGGRVDSKVTINGSQKKEGLVPPAPPIGDANLNIRDYVTPNSLDLKAYLEQFTARQSGYALFYDIEHHRFMIVRGTSREGTPGVQSVSISFADDPGIKDKDHPTTITIIGIMSGDDPYAKYRRTFKMPDQWGEEIHIYGCDEYIYSSQLNAIEETLAAILNHPAGDDLDQSGPNVVYPTLISETFWN